MDYWGAEAVRYSAGPRGEGQWYTSPDPNAGAGDFTPPPSSDGNSGPTIDQIHAQLHNSQPAHLSALADQWQNLYNLLDAIRKQLLDETTELADDKWKSGNARDAFLKTGPGDTLAYLDAWMDSALSNQTALRAIVSIILEYQAKMDPIWRDYQQAVKDAQNLSFGTKLNDWFWHYNLIGGGDQPDYDRATAQDKIEQINKVKLEYNVKAQKLAWAMADDMFPAFSAFSAGHGPVYRAPDAVFDPPDLDLPHVPNVGMVPVGAPPPPPSLPPPPAMPVPPPTPTPTGPPVVPTPIVTAPPPPVPSPPTVPAPPVVTPIVVPPVVDPVTVAGLGAPRNLPSPATEPATGAFQAPRTPNAGGLISRSATGMPEGSVPPAAAPRGMRGIGRGTPAGGVPPTTGRRAGGVPGGGAPAPDGEPGTEDLFGRSGASVPPVLGNSRRGRSRSAVPPVVTGDEISTGLPGRAGASPPVLARAQREDTKRRTGAVGDGTPVNAGETDLLPPTLRAPSAPAGVPDAEEAPSTLRAPVRATGTSPRELVNRWSGRKMRTPATEEQPEAAAPPTTEEMFSVETPGGGVLGAGQEPEGYVAQARAQVRAD
ncbi:MAG TPA: hypothetical protein VKB69_16810 [Micromonosporaceae bacterium]|nr:hypothetical protein [Micromonosporaceae bacterium]